MLARNNLKDVDSYIRILYGYRMRKIKIVGGPTCWEVGRGGINPPPNTNFFFYFKSFQITNIKKMATAHITSMLQNWKSDNFGQSWFFFFFFWGPGVGGTGHTHPSTFLTLRIFEMSNLSQNTSLCNTQYPILWLCDGWWGTLGVPWVTPPPKKKFFFHISNFLGAFTNSAIKSN